MQGYLKNGGLDGKWIWYYENGQIESKGSYVNGIKDGQWILKYQNGNIEGEYQQR